MLGKIKWFNAKKGFGFIICEDGKDLFAHISEFGGQTPQDEDNVEFEVGQGRKGPCAINISIT